MTETKETGLAAAIREANGGSIVTLIPADQIRPNPKNFYEMSDLDELATSIEAHGLIDPIKVRPDEDGLGYVLLDGERRFRAMTEILGWDMVQCLIYTPVDEIAEELMLIEANRTQRKMSAADLSKQAERYMELLSQLKDSGVQIPGRLRDRVAEALQVSSSKLARLQAIRGNCIPEILEDFDAGKLNESVAYELSKQPQEKQTAVYMHDGYMPEVLTAADVPALVTRACRSEQTKPRTIVSESITGSGWDAEAYLSQRRQEDGDFFAMLEKEADPFFQRLLNSTRQEGIAQLKERFGHIHDGWYHGEVMVSCEPKGLRMASEEMAIPDITRTWTEVYDMLCLIALNRASELPTEDESVSESNHAPAGLEWHETEKEGPPPAEALNIVCWGDAGLYKPMAHLIEQEFSTFPENCRWWATVEGPEEEA